jgi:hypothetical protein
MSSIDDYLDSLPKPTEKLPEEPKISEGDKLKEFFFPKSNLTNPYDEARRLEGKCPKCAMPGRISMSAFVCDIHGEF